MNILKNVVFLATGFFIAHFSNAQFSLTGEFRPRTEFSRGYKILSDENQDWSTLTTQRSRLNFFYVGEALSTKITLQDVRNWGGQPQLVANEDYATSVHEAWAEVFFAPYFSLRAGRQELNYDDHRIFGNVGWAQQARSHDIALLKYENGFNIHLGIAHHENSNQTNNLYDGPDAYKDLQFFWFNKNWQKSGLSFLFLNNGIPAIENSNQITKYSQTLGGRFTTVVKKASFATNLYCQTGKHASGKDISALNFLIEASLKNGFSAGYEYLSGNSYNKTDKIYAFAPFYGTNHKFNGFMDYFFVGNHINSVGLNDVYLKFKHSENNFGFNADLHYFASAGDISENANKYLGTELDITFLWKVQESAVISAGWSTMFAGENMELIKGGDFETGNYWAYIMLSVTPAFIK